MANYYTQFSCTLDVKTAENVSRALEIYKTTTRPENDNIVICENGLDAFSDENTPSVIYIRDDGGHGDPDMVIHLVKLCAKEFGLTGLWGFQYADTCSSPRPDAFGGGAVVIDLSTQTVHAYIDTDSWLAMAMGDCDPDA